MAQGFSQVHGIHYNEVFVPMTRMAAVRTVIAFAAIEDLELEAVDISTASLNGDVDAEMYMKISEGLEVDGEPLPELVKRIQGLEGMYAQHRAGRVTNVSVREDACIKNRTIHGLKDRIECSKLETRHRL